MRAGKPGRNEVLKDSPTILAFLPNWDALTPESELLLAYLEETYPFYRYDPERNPNSAKKCGVRVWPTFIVIENDQCHWKTHRLSVLLDGLGIEVELL